LIGRLAPSGGISLREAAVTVPDTIPRVVP